MKLEISDMQVDDRDDFNKIQEAAPEARPRLNPEWKEKWVAALRSGKYEQAEGALRAKSWVTGRYGFCCLGVLADVVAPEGWSDPAVGPGREQGNAHPSQRICNLVGLNDQVLTLCVKLNDVYKWNFTQIADWVEEFA